MVRVEGLEPITLSPLILSQSCLPIPAYPDIYWYLPLLEPLLPS